MLCSKPVQLMEEQEVDEEPLLAGIPPEYTLIKVRLICHPRGTRGNRRQLRM